MKQQFLSFLALIICVITPLFGQGKKNTSVPSHEFFIENKGQWPEEVKYLSRIKGMDAWVTNDGITYDLYSLKNKASSQVSAVKKIEYKRSGHVISMSFKNALSGVMTEAREEQPGYYNYFIGSDPAKWTSHVRLFKEVSLLKVYEGIDTRIYHDEGSLRYDMIVKAGADPNQIAMTFEGAHGVSINTKGELVVKTALGDVIQQKLFAFQEVAGKRKKVECSFAFNNGEVGFALGKYDKTKPLIIDPLIYSTYLGSSNTDQLTAIAVDTAGAIYVTGTTASQNYPIQPNELGVYDYIWEKGEVVVTKLSRDGRSLIYSTFVGGSAGEMGYGIAVDQTLNVYVCGITFGREVNPVRNWFPTTTGAYDQTFNDDPNLIAPVGDAFVFKINSSGSSLLYSTFIGGSSSDLATGIAVDANGNAYISGYTNSGNLAPSSIPGYDRTFGGGTDAFVVKVNASGSNLLYATYLGNTGPNTQENPPRYVDDLAMAIAVDNMGFAHVTGYTKSETFPTTAGAIKRIIGTGRVFQPPPPPFGPPPDPTYIHDEDIFITKLNQNGTSLVYSTFLGGDSTDIASGIAVDRQGNSWVTGYTYSGSPWAPASFPITSNAFDAILQKTVDGAADGCLTKINTNGSQVLYSTYIGGRGHDETSGIAIDSIGDVYVTGTTSSSDFPVITGLVEDVSFNGMQDVFALKMPSNGGQATYSSFLGGSAQDISRSITVDFLKDVYIAGSTQSADFPAKAYGGGPWDSTYSSSAATEDGFISKLRMACMLSVDAGRDTVLCPGDSVVIGSRATANSGLAPFTYSWSPNIEIKSNAFEAVVRPSTTRKYYLTVTDRIGCVTRDSVLITINPAIVAEAGGNAGGILETCSGRDTVIGREATGGAGGYKYKWSPSEGLSSDTVARPRLTAGSVSQKYYLVVTDTRGCTAVDSVEVIITAPASFSSTAPATGLNFGELDACRGDDSLTVTITNTSGRIIKVTDYRLSSGAWRVTTPAAGFNLSADPARADAKKTLTVKFSPQSAGVFNDTLRLITSPCGEEYIIPLTGSKLQPLFRADTNIYNFGRSYTCEPAMTRDTVIRVQNSGTGDITLKAPVIPAPYSLIGPPVSSFPRVVKAGESIELQIRLNVPPSEGPANAIAEIPYESASCPPSAISIDLVSERIGIVADIAFTTIQMPDITGCDSYQDTVVTLRNTSEVALTIHNMNPAAGIQLLGTLPVAIEPGEQIQLAVRYAPVGNQSTAIAGFVYGPCNDTLTATISGIRKGISFTMPSSIKAESVVLCRSSSTQGTASVVNHSGVDVTLTEDAAVTGPFSVTGLSKGTVLKDGIPVSFTYSFTPAIEGNYTGSIDLQFDLCNFDTTILLQGTASDATLAAQSASGSSILSMGAVSIGSFKEDSVEIQNTGSSPVTITSLGGLSQPFSIISPQPGFTIAAGSSRYVRVRYDAASEGLFKDTLITQSTDPCAITLLTEVTAGEETSLRGISEVAIIITSGDTLSSGETVRAELRLNSSQNLAQTNTRNYSAVISFNKNILKPSGSTPVGTTDATRRKITLAGTRGGDTVGVLQELEFTSMLGDVACSDIVIESFRWTDGNAEAMTTANSFARFCLAELCTAGGATRLVTSGGGEFMLMQNKPNPAENTTEIEYHLVEPGYTELLIMDIFGRTVKTVIRDPQHPAGHFSITVNTADIPAGYYLYVLKSPSQSQSLTLQVLK